MLDYENNIIEDALEQEFDEKFKYIPNNDYYGLPLFEGIESGYRYIATDNEDDVENACRDYIEGLIDDLGIDALNWDNMGGIDNYVDTDWFEEALRESMEYYIDDIRNEDADDDKYESRLEEEMADYNCEDEDEFLEKLIENAGDPIDWYIDNFGNNDFNYAVKQNNLFDIDKITQAVINIDGYGISLAIYDGEEYQINYKGSTVWAFRVE